LVTFDYFLKFAIIRAKSTAFN